MEPKKLISLAHLLLYFPLILTLALPKVISAANTTTAAKLQFPVAVILCILVIIGTGIHGGRVLN